MQGAADCLLFGGPVGEGEEDEFGAAFFELEVLQHAVLEQAPLDQGREAPAQALGVTVDNVAIATGEPGRVVGGVPAPDPAQTDDHLPQRRADDRGGLAAAAGEPRERAEVGASDDRRGDRVGAGETLPLGMRQVPAGVSAADIQPVPVVGQRHDLPVRERRGRDS
ncbi:unannotated protein [freshwater metagenome]|uniref:Unannotated protein n=1 Tax=freshwater metagenome TaxID=449393 RepID=A0A6J7KFC3_9ZZZZ